MFDETSLGPCKIDELHEVPKLINSFSWFHSDIWNDGNERREPSNRMCDDMFGNG